LFQTRLEALSTFLKKRACTYLRPGERLCLLRRAHHTSRSQRKYSAKLVSVCVFLSAHHSQKELLPGRIATIEPARHQSQEVNELGIFRYF